MVLQARIYQNWVEEGETTHAYVLDSPGEKEDTPAGPIPVVARHSGVHFTRSIHREVMYFSVE
jgi:hypothetical protein